ncbi:MAG: hypothetical protein OXI96_05070 [Acidimicrobiaceae bacterium]|nr:hypothetical protein [Acidimicrobiaceae bacterium]
MATAPAVKTDQESPSLADIDVATGLVSIPSEDKGHFHETTEAFIQFLGAQPHDSVNT